MNRKFFLYGCILSCAEFMVPAVSAQSFSAEVSPGTMDVKTEEQAYNHSGKQSQINWKSTNNPVIKAALKWDVTPVVSLGLSGWTTLAHSNASMSDYDWLDNKNGWDDKSESSKSKLNYANEFDVNTTYWLIPYSSYRLGLRLGYQESRFSWASYGGNYIYNDNGETLTGTFSDSQAGIGYKQKLSVPYIALTGQYIAGRFDVNAVAKYSSFVRLKGSDQHYLRDIHFSDDVKEADYYGVYLDVGYAVTPASRVFLGMNYNYYPTSRGESVEHNYDTGQIKSGGDGSSGISNRNYQLFAGLSVTM
ncbi:TPA: omptin family outer membrane protease [Citrobacter freundii]|nr:omptin family outer membrane protease [Citrobacter freundii]